MADHNPDMYENLVLELVNLQAQIDPLAGRVDDIKKVLRDLDYGTHKIAGVSVAVGRNVRLDPRKFEATYPVVENPHLYKAVPDADAIKRHLSPVQVEALQVEGEKRLTVK